MKLLLSLLFVFYLSPSYSQKTGTPSIINSNAVLVAKNSKHTRTYQNGFLLKIHYRQNGKIVKSKGRLFILKNTDIQLMPFGRKDIVTINVPDIISIGLWKRQAKITAAIIGATGALAIGLALAMQGPQRPGVAEGNLLGFMLTLYSITILWYEIIDIPAIILSEKLSIRSQKKGYEFYIDPNPPVQPRHRFRIL